MTLFSDAMGLTSKRKLLEFQGFMRIRMYFLSELMVSLYNERYTESAHFSLFRKQWGTCRSWRSILWSLLTEAVSCKFPPSLRDTQ